MPTKVIMPQLGESVVEGTVSRWLKQEGDSVQEMDALLEVNTDKVDTEIPSPAGGTLLKILVPEGETVRAGTVIAWIGKPDEAVPESPTQGRSSAGALPVDQALPVEQPAPAERAAPKDRVKEAAEPGAGASAEAIEETVEPTQPVMINQGRGSPGQRENGGTSTGQEMGQPSPVPGVPVPGVPVPGVGRSRELGFISPIVARLAQENNIDLARVTGTGEGGRITRNDVLKYIEQTQAAQPELSGAKVQQSEAEPAAAPWETPADGDLFRPTEMVFGTAKPAAPAPASAPSKPVAPAPAEGSMPGEGKVIPLNIMRRKIAEHMVTSKRTSPHVTTVMEADLHRVVAHYNANRPVFARDGAKLTYTAYFTFAAAQALRAFPIVNSSWTDAGIQLHPRVNLGLAVSLGEEGLIVPVLKDADELSLLGLARAIGDLANRAREHRLNPQDVQGGTFTITNHGISGSLFATPIINQPQCAILGVGAIQKRVVVIEDAAGGDTIAIRPMVYLSLTFDHRILDGASGDSFLAKVVEVLENWA